MQQDRFNLLKHHQLLNVLKIVIFMVNALGMNVNVILVIPVLHVKISARTFARTKVNALKVHAYALPVLWA